MKEHATAASAAADADGMESARSAGQPPFDRAEGLSPSARKLLADVVECARLRRADQAEQILPALMALAPAHPEVLRVRALVAHLRARYHEAASLLKRALEERPFDALGWNNLGSALAEAGDLEGAVVAFRKCAELAPQRAAPWFNIGNALDMIGRIDEAHDALREALKRDPNHVSARVTLARVLQFMGRIAESETEYRRVLGAHPESALAWYGLSTLRTSRFSEDDVRAIERVYGRPNLASEERIGAGFALAKALEDQHRYTEGFAVLTAANSAKRRLLHWDARLFSQYIDSIAGAFAQAPASAAPPDHGREVVFVFGLPRSGTTLVEQILAAHPEVSGANELEDLNRILAEESRRRGSPFPAWVHQADPSEWKRLGDLYLERTAAWRKDRPIFTDKALSNWGYVGALRAMLPGAKLINCRRDPVENCLACFRQSFAKELGFTYDLAEIASFWRDYDRLVKIWHQRYPGQVHDVVHERLIADPEGEIRALLAFCGLPFDPSVLSFHEAERNVRTASAAQVRQPLRADTARAGRYGALLDPLRAMLAQGALGIR
ncbi:MAG TPA: sulfotransferase [Rhodanobacteraceae bacterium]|nr:sulfotransferase [Rhodanobacteraceae bacterium]